MKPGDVSSGRACRRSGNARRSGALHRRAVEYLKSVPCRVLETVPTDDPEYLYIGRGAGMRTAIAHAVYVDRLRADA